MFHAPSPSPGRATPSMFSQRLSSGVSLQRLVRFVPAPIAGEPDSSSPACSHSVAVVHEPSLAHFTLTVDSPASYGEFASSPVNTCHSLSVSLPVLPAMAFHRALPPPALLAYKL